MTVTTIDPSTGRPIANYEETTAAELDSIPDRACLAARDWGRASPTERAVGLNRLAVSFRERQEELARLATTEMGKPLLESRAEVEKCARTCDWYANYCATACTGLPPTAGMAPRSRPLSTHVRSLCHPRYAAMTRVAILNWIANTSEVHQSISCS